ncbi:gp436 family protein [Parasedimentitalea psychrophila]|uniref:DUF1320 domain-containing protein n=1 Tax=Parasedimentitalea psychrophila TaxID=2997337 RepID=A0A9Y2KZ10_9RHOB|nr:DUF1320 domain-containing protein [Parasedimentitalea psychrophila]WIY25059.1 DUF1320 domain-containing protein [Parasedimentitalea psychrophila]
MAYTTLQQLIDRYGEAMLIGLTDRDDVSTGAVDPETIDQAIASAGAQIDGYVGSRYALPMAEVPPLIAKLARAITCWELHVYAAPDKITEDYKEAVATLKDISRGAVVLDIAGTQPEGNGSSGIQITDRKRPLEASKMGGLI